MNRGLRFGALQLAGLALLMSIPVLAAFNVFGESRAIVSDRASALSLTVDYPARIRHGVLDVVAALVTNLGPASLDTVRVRFDSSYVPKFTEPAFIPSASGAFEVELTDIAPGETQRVQVSARANEYGRHRGRVAASHGADTVEVVISTIVFP